MEINNSRNNNNDNINNILNENLKYFNDIMPKNIISKDFIDFLIKNNYFTSPSSTKYHGAFIGGNFEHSVKVTSCLLELTYKLGLKWSRPESPYIIGMFHDLCKIDNYVISYNDDCKNLIIDYNVNCKDKRHAEKSIDILENFIDLTEEEKLCILHHMGAYRDKSYWNPMSDALDKYHNILWTHVADMEAAHFYKI